MAHANSLANLRSWKPGQSGNPAGRSANRIRLEKLVTDDILASWEANGKDALNRVLADDPAAYVRAVLTLIPKNEQDGDEGVSRDRIKRALAILESWVAEAGDPESTPHRAA